MNALDQYWNMQCISPGNHRLRYQTKPLPTAQTFFESQLPEGQRPSRTASALKSVQTGLLLQFQSAGGAVSADDRRQQALAGLCLRCYVSTPILRACQKIDSLFSGNKAFSYQDLLPFVLTDDGKKLLVVDGNKTQLVLDSEQAKPATYKLFSVDVLDSYQSDSAERMSLDNWTFLRTKQHPELKSFLSEFGFQQFSDWTLINRIQVNQLERLSKRDRAIVQAFHAVYRRDRAALGKVGRCPNPTDAQLTEMNHWLSKQGLDLSSTEALFKALKQIGKQIRTFDVWQAREPLEIQDTETGDYTLRTDLPAQALDETDLEEQDFMAFLNQQLKRSLAQAIESSVKAKIAKLEKSNRYSPYAKSFVPGLLRYYQEGLSLKDIGQQLGMESWERTRRILNPGELLSQVRGLVTQQLLETILAQAKAKGLTGDPPEPAYLEGLMIQLEAFLDEKLFSSAAAELKAGKNRSLDSDYAQQLMLHLATYDSR